MQARGRHADDDVSDGDAMRAQHVVGINHAGGGTRDVVVVLGHESGVLSGFPTDQWAINRGASFSNATHDVCDALGVNLPGCDVVRHQ